MRYAAAIDLFRERYRPDMDILEVGSGSGGVTNFLRFPVTGLDSAFDRTAHLDTPYLIPIEGVADAIPFHDAAFDVVLSLEMLEHIPARSRERVLAELFRVLRPGGRLIVSFPADQTARHLDLALNESYRKRYGKDHPWVIEHLREGHPSTAEMAVTMRRLVGNSGVVSTQKHDPGRSWLAHHKLYTVRSLLIPAYLLGLHSRMGATMLFKLLKRMPGGAHYRTILVVDRYPQRPARGRAIAASS
jgi:SAM-dependent methyltransferase